MPARRIPVLIAGGGPVGLALAAELGWQGVSCELVEQGAGAVKTPKMNEVNTRSMEFCRRWGIADEVLRTPFPLDYPKDVVFVTDLAGYELGRVKRPPRRVRSSQYSPETTQTCSQHWFDPILQRFARSFASVRLRHRCRLESFSPQSSHVTATLCDASGARETVEADYLVGCDGANSSVRRALGIALEGEGTLGVAINLFFVAPGLLDAFGRHPGTFFILLDEGGVWGNLRIIDPNGGLWRLMVNETDARTTAEGVERQALLRRALGRDHPVEWIDVNVWHRRSALAQSYSAGRVFLAGDAVHQVSPTGALGMNTGLGDAVDLGWKLAASLAGWGGPALLESYDGERRAVGRRNVRMATEFHSIQSRYCGDLTVLKLKGAAGDALRRSVGEALVSQVGREFRTLGLQIGYRYEGSNVIVPDGSPEAPDDPENYRSSARPGMRAPHAWLADGRSVLDLFGRGFTLLCFGKPAPAVMEREAAVRGMPLQAVVLDEPKVQALYERRFILVRPDGHVAWRADAVAADCGAILDRVRGAT